MIRSIFPAGGRANRDHGFRRDSRVQTLRSRRSTQAIKSAEMAEVTPRNARAWCHVTVSGDDSLKARKNGLIKSGGSGTDQPIVVATVCSRGRPSSQRPHSAYVPRSASWVLPSQSENHKPREQPSEATPSVTTNALRVLRGRHRRDYRERLITRRWPRWPGGRSRRWRRSCGPA